MYIDPPKPYVNHEILSGEIKVKEQLLKVQIFINFSDKYA